MRINVGETELFLLSDDGVQDLDQACDSSEGLAVANVALLPPAIFLRTAFGAVCWTNPFPAANLVIDDPMIRPRYGFVAYEQLMTEASVHGYAVTIAFIPFNHRRSDRRTAEFLRGHRERFSIAVHGCDHTSGEFGAQEPDRLLHISRLALERMRRHETKSGMPFDPVMVFPQGFFSAAAFAALKRSGYDAVVNTELWPKAGKKPHIALRDLLAGATMVYSGFPLFSRRYPKSIFEFATDLFWGKPVLLVEHHAYFKEGYPQLAEFVRQLGQLTPKLTWKPVGAVVTEHALFRPDGTGRVAVKFFTPTFRLRNPTSSAAIFSLAKTETEPELVEQVTVNGSRVDFKLAANLLRLEVNLAGADEALVKIAYRVAPTPAYRLSARYRYSAAARRYLSEFRDNYVARNSRLLAVATKLKGLLRRR